MQRTADMNAPQPQVATMVARCQASLLAEGDTCDPQAGFCRRPSGEEVMVTVEPLWTTVLCRDAAGYRMAQVRTADVAALDAALAHILETGTTH